ncbi:MAG: hypothetical protein V1882_10470 [Candidatus Omnitrophota bacterium]
MAKWVLDENVFKTACDLRQGDLCHQALVLIDLIYDYHQIVFDFEEKLLGKYRPVFNASPLLQAWYTKIIHNAGHVEYRSSNIENAVEDRLDILGFDPDDRCYVATALRADGLVVAEDGDYFEEKVAAYWKEIGLRPLKIKPAKDEEAKMR